MEEQQSQQNQQDTQNLPVLKPSNYAAPAHPDSSLSPLPPGATSRPLSEGERAALLPFPLSTQAREKHIILTVRPGDTQRDYFSKRSIGWAMQLEQLAEESVDAEYKRGVYTDLLKLSVATAARDAAAKEKERAAQEKAAKAQGGDIHLHQHVHSHNHKEISEISGLSSHDLAALSRVYDAQIEAARQGGKRIAPPTQPPSRSHARPSQGSALGSVEAVEAELVDSEEEDAL